MITHHVYFFVEKSENYYSIIFIPLSVCRLTRCLTPAQVDFVNDDCSGVRELGGKGYIFLFISPLPFAFPFVTCLLSHLLSLLFLFDSTFSRFLWDNAKRTAKVYLSLNHNTYTTNFINMINAPRRCSKTLIYRIYPKYSDTSTPYHICSKIWTSTIHYPMLCLNMAGWVANSVDPDETPRSAASHLGLYCLLRPVCPNIPILRRNLHTVYLHFLRML